MRFGTAIERLVDNYEYAKSKIWIRDEVAWALYHTWKEADDRKDEPNNSEIPNNCKEPQTENLFTDKYGDVWEWRGDAWYCISGQDEPQTDCAWR